ncbi:hypothetical protein I4U23_016700 [Adineta vaga]|nr:hypothetical protein I4U23_016700 [Adineta vaga]
MRELRQHPPNRVILTLLVLLLIQALFDLPCRLYYLYKGTSPIHNEIFCQLWSFIVTTLNVVGLHLMALGSIERYLLVFHHRYISKYRLYLSTIPIIICIIYPIIWYVTLMYTAWWCTYTPDYGEVECGLPCYITASSFYLSFIIYVHHLIPVFTTTFANIILVGRVLHQQAKMKRNNSWRRNLQMTTQLLSIAFLYLILWLPHCILASIPLFVQGDISIQARFLYTEYFANLTSIFVCLCPFIALIGLNHLHNKIKYGIQIIRKCFLPCYDRQVASVAPE